MLLPPTYFLCNSNLLRVREHDFCPNEKKSPAALTDLYPCLLERKRGTGKKSPFFFFVLGKNAFGASAVLPIAAAALVFLWILKSRVGLFPLSA